MNTEGVPDDRSRGENEDLDRAIREEGPVALFPPFTGNGRAGPSQPAMFLVYLCGTWVAARFVILILVFVGAMSNPAFPWGFLRPIQPGDNGDFLDHFLALMLTLIIYARFFYRYNDYLYHVTPTRTPVDFMLDCLVGISGLAIIVAAGDYALMGAAFSSLFAFASLKYLHGYRVSQRVANPAAKVGTDESRLWRLNARIMRKKFLYDLAWGVVFAFFALLGIWANRVFLAIVFAALIPAQLVYMNLADPSQMALREIDPARRLRPWVVASAWFGRIYRLSRPYSIAYVALLGLLGVLSSGESCAPKQVALALSLGPLVWLSMLSFHDLAHARADARAARGRGWVGWMLLPFGIASLLTAVGLSSTAGTLTLVMVLVGAVFGGLYGVAKGVPVVSNILRGCVTSSGVVAAASISAVAPLALLLAFGAGFLDASGNVLGDIRDTDCDRKAGTRTIAVISVPLAKALSLIFLLGSVLFFSFVRETVLPLLILGVAAIFFARRRACHLWFLLVKYSCVGIIALSLTTNGTQTVIVFVLGLLAIPSALVYRELHQLNGRTDCGIKIVENRR